jgi:hypothetical protein
MDCLEPAQSVIIRSTVLGALKELLEELKTKFNPDFEVVSTDDGYAVVTTVPRDALHIILCQTWADGWMTRHQNPIL